jgi:hypothetical protein
MVLFLRGVTKLLVHKPSNKNCALGICILHFSTSFLSGLASQLVSFQVYWCAMSKAVISHSNFFIRVFWNSFLSEWHHSSLFLCFLLIFSPICLCNLDTTLGIRSSIVLSKRKSKILELYIYILLPQYFKNLLFGTCLH